MHPKLASSLAYSRLSWRRGVTPKQFEHYQQLAAQFMREYEREKKYHARLKGIKAS